MHGHTHYIHLLTHVECVAEIRVVVTKRNNSTVMHITNSSGVIGNLVASS